VRFGPNVYARHSFRDSILEQDEERHGPDPERDGRGESSIVTLPPEAANN
jgi:hypothetical protein